MPGPTLGQPADRGSGPSAPGPAGHGNPPAPPALPRAVLTVRTAGLGASDRAPGALATFMKTADLPAAPLTAAIPPCGRRTHPPQGRNTGAGTNTGVVVNRPQRRSLAGPAAQRVQPPRLREASEACPSHLPRTAITGRQLRFTVVMAADSTVGAVRGGPLLGVFSDLVLIPPRAVILVVSAVKLSRHAPARINTLGLTSPGHGALTGPETLAVFEQQLREGLSSGPADMEHAGAGDTGPRAKPLGTRSLFLVDPFPPGASRGPDAGSSLSDVSGQEDLGSVGRVAPSIL